MRQSKQVKAISIYFGSDVGSSKNDVSYKQYISVPSFVSSWISSSFEQ